MEIEFEIGNTHHEVKKGMHKWACYFKATDPSIEKNMHKIKSKGKFELHESFKNPVRWVESRQGKTFQLDCGGWGYFDLPVTIYFKKETGKGDQPFSITWPLSFDGTDKSKKIKLTFNAQKITPLLGHPPARKAVGTIGSSNRAVSKVRGTFGTSSRR